MYIAKPTAKLISWEKSLYFVVKELTIIPKPIEINAIRTIRKGSEKTQIFILESKPIPEIKTSNRNNLIIN